MERLQNRRAVFALLLALLTVGGCASAEAPTSATADVRTALAPTGTLRIAVYPGSPTSLVRQPGSDETHGMTVDIGRELARRLGVPATLVEVERVEQVVDALRTGRADMTITNASPARAALLDFTEPVVLLESGILVPRDSPISALGEIDRPGVRVGVSQGGTSHATFARTYPQPTVVAVPSLEAAREMLSQGRLDAFASNKAILYQLAGAVPGARVLEGRWSTESLAIAVPQGRSLARPWLLQFAASVRDGGDVQRAAERAGLRGLAAH
ncbi:MAG: transporter substrate-binding domain-containing protein [Rhizobacter sp.]|nr:transporter substrate-binding domain-containing protein [Rhizobacter sp.]